MNDTMSFPFQEKAINQLQKNRKWILGLGIGFSIIGALAILFSVTATIVSILYLGALLVVAGFFEGAKAFNVRTWRYALLHGLLSILYIFAGVYMILNPALNALTLTLVLAVFFIIAGIMKIIFGLTQPVLHKGWLLLSGVLSIILGILIWQQWPYSGLWVLGTLIGIEFLFTGIAWIMLAIQAKLFMQRQINQQ
jgi:uncharacterized membrane protein HdeD (DUF308 family)